MSKIRVTLDTFLGNSLRASLEAKPLTSDKRRVNSSFSSHPHRESQNFITKNKMIPSLGSPNQQNKQAKRVSGRAKTTLALPKSPERKSGPLGTRGALSPLKINPFLNLSIKKVTSQDSIKRKSLTTHILRSPRQENSLRDSKISSCIPTSSPVMLRKKKRTLTNNDENINHNVVRQSQLTESDWFRKKELKSGKGNNITVINSYDPQTIQFPSSVPGKELQAARTTELTSFLNQIESLQQKFTEEGTILIEKENKLTSSFSEQNTKVDTIFDELIFLVNKEKKKVLETLQQLQNTYADFIVDRKSKVSQILSELKFIHNDITVNLPEIVTPAVEQVPFQKILFQYYSIIESANTDLQIIRNIQTPVPTFSIDQETISEIISKISATFINNCEYKPPIPMNKEELPRETVATVSFNVTTSSNTSLFQPDILKSPGNREEINQASAGFMIVQSLEPKSPLAGITESNGKQKKYIDLLERIKVNQNEYLSFYSHLIGTTPQVKNTISSPVPKQSVHKRHQSWKGEEAQLFLNISHGQT